MTSHTVFQNLISNLKGNDCYFSIINDRSINVKHFQFVFKFRKRKNEFESIEREIFGFDR